MTLAGDEFYGDDVTSGAGLRLVPVRDCGICERREADCTVVLDGRIVPICSTCYERADERGGDDR